MNWKFIAGCVMCGIAAATIIGLVISQAGFWLAAGIFGFAGGLTALVNVGIKWMVEEWPL